MKKIFVSALTVLLLIGAITVLNSCSCGSELIDGAFWSLNPDGESYRLDQLDKEYSKTSYVVPETINGKPVTVIGYGAFSPYFPHLESVTLPSTITKIERIAFSDCTGLKSVNIPKGVTEIGDAAFQNCQSLVSIVIPNSVTSIGTATFKDCKSLTSVTLPNSVTSIGTAVFKNCSSLTSVTLPDKLGKIPESTFYGCQSLTSVNIPNRVTVIEKLAFCGCSALETINIPNSVSTIGGFVFDGIDAVKTLSIPASVTSLEGAPHIMGKRLEKIKYSGTMGQWYQITGTSNPINYPVHCFDGIIKKEETKPSK